MIEQVPSWGWTSTNPQCKKETLLSTSRDWNPTTPQWKEDSHSRVQTHNKGTITHHKLDEKTFYGTRFSINIYI